MSSHQNEHHTTVFSASPSLGSGINLRSGAKILSGAKISATIKKNKKTAVMADKCGICLDTIDPKNAETVTTRCGHRFCYSCFVGHGLHSSNSTACPNCRGTVTHPEMGLENKVRILEKEKEDLLMQQAIISNTLYEIYQAFSAAESQAKSIAESVAAAAQRGDANDSPVSFGPPVAYLDAMGLLSSLISNVNGDDDDDDDDDDTYDDMPALADLDTNDWNEEIDERSTRAIRADAADDDDDSAAPPVNDNSGGWQVEDSTNNIITLHQGRVNFNDQSTPPPSPPFVMTPGVRAHWNSPIQGQSWDAHSLDNQEVTEVRRIPSRRIATDESDAEFLSEMWRQWASTAELRQVTADMGHGPEFLQQVLDNLDHRGPSWSNNIARTLEDEFNNVAD